MASDTLRPRIRRRPNVLRAQITAPIFPSAASLISDDGLYDVRAWQAGHRAKCRDETAIELRQSIAGHYQMPHRMGYEHMATALRREYIIMERAAAAYSCPAGAPSTTWLRDGGRVMIPARFKPARQSLKSSYHPSDWRRPSRTRQAANRGTPCHRHRHRRRRSAPASFTPRLECCRERDERDGPATPAPKAPIRHTTRPSTR